MIYLSLELIGSKNIAVLDNRMTNNYAISW